MFASYLKKASELASTASELASTAASNAVASDFLGQAREAARAAAEAAAKVADTVQAEYQKTFVDLDCQIIEVRPQVQVTEFPSEDKVVRLSTRLNAEFPQRMMILNMSERTYDTGKFEGQVVDVNFRGLPAPPVELLMELCLSAQNWLASDDGNVLVVHCFQGYSRSAVFLSCFFAFRGFYSGPVDALHEVCKKLNISDKQDILPSQRRYLTYFQQCIQGFTPPRSRLKLLRLQLNGVPKFESDDAAVFRPFLEIWAGGELVHSSLTSKEGEAVSLPEAFSSSESCAAFALPADFFVSGDVLIRIRHVYSDGRRANALRLTFHTGFVQDGFQLARHELDNACSDPRFSADAFLDLIFEREAPGGSLGLEDTTPPPVYQKARDVAKKLADEERRRREAEAAAVAANGAALADTDADEFAELEATLLRGAAGSPAPGPAAGAEAKTTAAREPAPAPVAAASAAPAASAAAAPELAEAPAKAAAATAPFKVAPAAAAPATGAVAAPSAAEKAAAPAAKAAFQPPERKPASAAKAAEATKAASNEMDDLFNEFDAALASFGDTGAGGTAPAAGAETKGAAGEKTKPAASAAPATSAAKADGAKATDKGKGDDPFGDVDAFFAELDAA